MSNLLHGANLPNQILPPRNARKLRQYNLAFAKLPNIVFFCLALYLQVTYGFNGVFVFEHTVDEFESKSTVSESLKTVVKNLPMEDLHEAVPLKVGKVAQHL